jgi:FtsP/CotA-like multicopper oxidase with cupredoxin domain
MTMYKSGKLPTALRAVLLASCAAPLVGVHAGNLFEGTIDGAAVPKFVEPLIIPPAMPKHGDQTTWWKDENGKWQYRSADYYKIAVRQFDQQVLPTQSWADSSGEVIPESTETTVWGYGSVDMPGTIAEGGSFAYPAFTVEAKANRPDRVKWINDLVDEDGNYLPHLLPVDQTLHWANPMRDCRPHTMIGETPKISQGEDATDCVGRSAEPYTGPVPMVAHLHGAHVDGVSDGYPEAWWLPKAKNLPEGISTHGRLFDDINGKDYKRGNGRNDGDTGFAVYEYSNDQKASTLWYHDHSMGMTRNNVYAGPAGFWLVRDDEEKSLNLPGPAPKSAKLDPKKRYYEIPLVLQDRSFNLDGSLFYPSTRAHFDGFEGPFLTDSDDGENSVSDMAPMWNPEAFFENIVVNGRTWPYLDVEPRQYRFRMLNGSNSRFFNVSLKAYSESGDLLGEVPFFQIGGDGGLMPQVVEVLTGTKTPLPGDGTVPTDKLAAAHPDEAMLMGPAERMDVIVDFSNLPQGTAYVRMENTAPDSPFGGFPVDEADMADPASTGLVMEFRPNLKLARRGDRSTPVAELKLPSMTPLKADRPLRSLSLNEMESSMVDVFGNPLIDVGIPMAPHSAMLGYYDPETGVSTPTMWADPIKNIVDAGGTEEWEVYNLTVDAHPVHLHLVQFQVVERRNQDGSPIDRDGDGVADCEAPCVAANETGWKDTVLAYPGEVTKVIAHFDNAGLYVWHCHILEHEDNEMMLPFCVGKPGEDCPSILFDDADLPEEFKGTGLPEDHNHSQARNQRNYRTWQQ